MAAIKSHHIEQGEGPENMPGSRFQFEPGDRPIDGYTIKHAAGRGGFGEVYYAVSDAGREVALKAIQTGEQIELRGISQCMNLKSPHLVTIFDVRHSERGQPFVLMEYVSGPSLRELLDESPSGLGEQKAAFFLREIAKGLAYLHDSGIVHRDLKPGNIFYEDGYVKICDYGLSKAIGASPMSGQTITVGTVHYMAPEIGQGRYDRAIDIYALGCVLYEMLTGSVPYFGSSPAEILFKHVQGEPDLEPVPQPFRRVIEKAMAKDPADRYASVQAMVEDVFGSSHVQQSMAGFSPADLSMHAAKVSEKLQRNHPEGVARSAEKPATPGVFKKKPNPAAPPAPTPHKKSDATPPAPQASSPTPGKPQAHAFSDPAPLAPRAAVAATSAGAIGIASGWFAGPGFGVAAMLMLMGAVGGALVLRRFCGWLDDSDAGFAGRLSYAVAMFGGAAAVGLPVLLVTMPWTDWRAVLAALAASFVILNFNTRAHPARGSRIAFHRMVMAALVALAAAWVLGAEPTLLLAVVGGAAVILEMVSPYHPGRVAREKNHRHSAAAARRVTRKTPRPTGPPRLMPDSSGSLPPGVSPVTRVLLLLMTALAFFGIFGIQRFVVGKIWTGLLWFFTGGLFGIGQIVDTVLIATGNFRDADGGRVVMWHSTSELRNHRALPAPAPGGAATSARRSSFDVKRVALGMLSLFAILTMLAATGIGLAWAIDLPGLVASGLLDKQVAQEIYVEHGEAWAPLTGKLIAGVWLVLMGVATTLLLVARRGAEAAHIGRAVAGAGALIGALAWLRYDRVDWTWLAERVGGVDPAVVMDSYLAQAGPDLATAGLIAMAGVVLLSWPDRSGGSVDQIEEKVTA